MDAHLVRLAKSHADVRRERDELTARVAELEQQLGHYREIEQRIGNALLIAEGAAAETQQRAADQAEQIRAEASAHAEGIVRDAGRESEQLLVDVERLRGLRAELVSSYRAFLLSALEAVEEYRNGQEHAQEEAREPQAVGSD